MTMTPGEHYALNNYGDDVPNIGHDIDPLERARGFYIPGPYKLEGAIPDYDQRHPGAIRNAAIRRGFTVCRLAGLVMDLSAYYEMTTIRYFVSFTEDHRFFEASGEGWLFGPGDYTAFMSFIDKPIRSQAERRPAFIKPPGRPHMPLRG